jgi:glycosidase
MVDPPGQDRTMTNPLLRTRSTLLAAVGAATALAACGGGGGGSAPPADPGANLPPVNVSGVALSDPGSTLPAGWQNGAFMEILVRSYKDSNGDGIGDLRGLTAQLDYLRDLGISGIWLLPVTRSQDHDHGYAVADYRDIETQYGSVADLDELLHQAHARGIGVIMDYVINHSAAENPLFVNAKASASNPYRDWYVWQGIKPSGWNIYGNDPWRGSTGNYYFAPFWDQMPDWNLTNPLVVTYHHDNLRFWLNRGVDGFRFDAVGNLVENGASQWENQPQNYVLLRDTRQLMNGYAQRFLVCEGPSDPRGYTSACGSAFAFDNRTNILDAAKGDAAAVQRVAAFHTTAPTGMSTMLANHDSFAGDRVFNQLAGNLAQYKLAAATYLLQPGTPFIYYGEEIGMARGSQGGDAGLRTPMSWTADAGTAGFTSGTPYRSLSLNAGSFNVALQQADPASLLSFYKAMLTLRRGLPSVAQGSYDNPAVNGSVLSFERRLGNERTLVAINYGATTATAALAGLPANATLANAYPGGGADAAADGTGQASVALPAQSLRVFSLR